MKTWSFVCAAVALTLATTVTAGNAQGPTPPAASCDLIKIFSIVKPLESNADVKKCIAATGYELLPPPGAPTKDQIAKLCDNASCKTVFAALQKMDIPDCAISILGGLNMKKVISEAFGQCSGTPSNANGKSEPPPTKPSTPTTPPAAPTSTPLVTPSSVPAVTPAGKGGAQPASTPAPGPASVPATPSPQAPVPSGNAKLPDKSGAGSTPVPAATPGPVPASQPASGKGDKNGKGGKGGKKLCHD